ncbi:MAG: FadR family transcriptional regulator [Desulfobacteraceae bacterium]|nr:FadR family transcriptional regulator [Desulfobacteraceae bacterium]
MKTTLPSMFSTVDKLEKVSDNIIAQIRDNILSGKFKPGDKLAAEKELISQFGVSKATMREALRVLEVMGLIEIRKGIAGGAYVAEVNMKTTIHSIINFLHFQPVSIKEITMLRYLIEPAGAQIAASKITDKDIHNLRGIIGDAISPADTELSKEISFHRYLARMGGNTLLILIIDFIDNILRAVKSELNLGLEFYQNVRKAHEITLECLIQNDSAAAGIAMTNDILEVGRYLCRVNNSSSFDPSELQHNKTIADLQLSLNPQTRVVAEGDPILQKQGTLIKRVGATQLYIVLCEDDKTVIKT